MFQCLIALVALFGCALATATIIPAATTVFRSPYHDTAFIQSDRIGGNFAYNTVEGHAFRAVAPVVQHVARPIAYSYQPNFVPLTYATGAFGARLPYAYNRFF